MKLKKHLLCEGLDDECRSLTRLAIEFLEETVIKEQFDKDSDVGFDPWDFLIVIRHLFASGQPPWRLSTGEEVPDYDKEIPRVEADVRILIKLFLNHRLLKKLNREAREAAAFIIQSFAQEMFFQFHLLPSQWRSGPAVACSLFGIPRNFVAPPAVIEFIEPVLTAFLLYGAETGVIPRGARIAEALEGLGPIITKREAMPHLWGETKKKIIEAEDKGIDITNIDAVKDYLAKNGTQKNIVRGNHSQGNNRPKRNDPCPCTGMGRFVSAYCFLVSDCRARCFSVCRSWQDNLSPRRCW